MLHEGRKLAIDAPFHDPIVGLIGKINVPLRIARWTFRKLEIAGEFFQFVARSSRRVPSSARMAAAENRAEQNANRIPR